MTDAPGPCYAAHAKELKALGCITTADAQIALALAAAIDDRAGVINLASTGKTLSELMKAIRDARPSVEGSVSDDLKRRRDARRTAQRNTTAAPPKSASS